MSKIVAHRNHRNTQKLCFACCSAKVCAVCVRQFHSAGYSCKLTSATFGSCPFVAQKNTSRYAQIRGDFSVDSVWKLLHADAAELRRRFAKLCAFAWEERYVPLFLCPKFCLTQNTRNTQNFASHASADVCAVCVKQFHPAWFCVFRVFRVRQSPHAARHYVILSKNLCVISSASRTHGPYVPTGQVISRMLMRRHNMTSLRSLYVPHGITLYSLLTTH